jgi:hypothetical protein
LAVQGDAVVLPEVSLGSELKMKLFILLVAFVGARAYAVPEHQHAKYKGMEVPYSDPPVAEGEDPGVPYEDPYEEKEKQPRPRLSPPTSTSHQKSPTTTRTGRKASWWRKKGP